MKKLFMLVLSGVMVIAVSGLIFIGCTKEGPQGPAGANGTNGKDANATCTQCHNFGDTVIVKIFQYDASKHASASTIVEADRATCSGCHSHEGFLEKLQTHSTVTQAYNDAAPINCRTCHQIHNNYNSTDWTLRDVSPVMLYIDTTKTVDLTVSIPGGKPDGTSNLCGKCHQARLTSPWVTNPKGTDSLSVSSNRWGPHHGPQFMMLAGVGAFEMGTTTFGITKHKDVATCRNCHMGPAQGESVGGHTLWMSSSETGDNVAACKVCHSSIGTTFDFNGKQTEIQGLYNTLKVKLAQKNVLDTNTMLLKGVSSSKPKKFTQIQLAVYWNFSLVDADRSTGIHNYLYIKDMLNAGIAYMNSLP